MMFLEAQFGADHVSPIAEPKLPPTPPPLSPPSKKQQQQQEQQKAEEDPSAPKKESEEKEEEDPDGGESMDVSEDEDELNRRQRERLQQRQQSELARLHKMGIPVPGLAVKVDKMEAKIWLETLEVESGNRVFADRVRAVVERAVEVAAPLWG